MGLGSFKKEDVGQSNRYYPDHEKQEELEKLVENHKDKFPGGVEVTYIEVSTQMDKFAGRAYFRSDGDYIRIAEWYMNSRSWEDVKRVVIHEMVHLWMNQNGYDYSDADRVFNWVCGYLKADLHAREDEEYEVFNKFIGD